MTDHYLGVAISDLTAPLEATSVSRFAQLTKPFCNPNKDKKCLQKSYAYFAFDRKKKASFRNDSNQLRKFDGKSDFKIYSYLITNEMDKNSIHSYTVHRFLRNHVHDKYMKIRFQKLSKILPKNLTQVEIALVNLYNPQHINIPGDLGKDNNVENEIEGVITNCGRTALMEKTSLVLAERNHLARFYPGVFTLSGETVQPEQHGWSFQPPGFSGIPTFLHWLTEAGMAQLLRRYQTELTYQVRRISSRKRARKESGNNQIEGSIH